MFIALYATAAILAGIAAALTLWLLITLDDPTNTDEVETPLQRMYLVRHGNLIETKDLL